jgi:hypothetical protein
MDVCQDPVDFMAKVAQAILMRYTLECFEKQASCSSCNFNETRITREDCTNLRQDMYEELRGSLKLATWA